MSDESTRYLEGDAVLLGATSVPGIVIRDYGHGAQRTIEARTASGKTIAVSAINVKRDPNPHANHPTTQMNPSSSATRKPIYQVNGAGGSVQFGTYVATNKDGQMLIAPVGGGDIIVADADTVEEVRPWTFTAVSLDTNQVFEYIHKPDVLKVGDLITAAGGGVMMRVTKTNTRSNTATQHFKGSRIASEQIN